MRLLANPQGILPVRPRGGLSVSTALPDLIETMLVTF